MLHKPIIVSKDCLNKSEDQEIKKIKPVIRNSFDALIRQNSDAKQTKNN